MHIICDMDGTLFDTEYEVSVITAALATAAGFAADADDIFCMCAGMGAREKFVFVTAQSGRVADAGLLDQLAADHEAMKAEIYLRDTLPPMTGLNAFLRRVESLGARLSVGSSNPTTRQALGLARAGIASFFEDRLYGPDLVMGRKKPDPAIFNLAIAQSGIAAADTIVIEDTEAGIIAGHRAGAHVVALLDPRFGEGAVAMGKAADFRSCGADAVVRGLDEIDIGLLRRLVPGRIWAAPVAKPGVAAI